MSISYIFTRGGLSLVINGKPLSIEQSHPNYQQVLEKLKANDAEAIPDLINRAEAVQTYINSSVESGNVTVDVDAGEVCYKGEPVNNAIVDHIFKMMNEGFTVTPLLRFLDNMMENPSKKAVDQLYMWITANGITITEDGHMLAYKRVNNDYRSFYDNKTMHVIGEIVSMPRNAVDDRSEVTCSQGLHFCSHAYLSAYHSGSGRILVLKINPRDVVSIPNDYNNSKGRACSYLVLEELKDEARVTVEDKPVITQAVVTETTNLNQTEEFKRGYQDGYKDGRGKQKRVFTDEEVERDPYDFSEGYCAGYKDGRKKNPKLY